MGLFSFEQFNPDEKVAAAWLRAVEWMRWPAFLAQPTLPVLYAIYPWPSVLLWFLIVTVVWIAIRHRVISIQLATVGCFFVKLRWITIPGMAAYFAYAHHWWLMALTLGTFWVVTAVSFVAMLTGKLLGAKPPEILPVQTRFLLQMGMRLEDLTDELPDEVSRSVE